MATSAPNRWTLLGHPDGFSPESFAIFRTSCDVFAAYCRATVQHQEVFGRGPEHPPIECVFFPPEISKDAKIVSLPIGGVSSLATRSSLEDMASYMLWQHLPVEIMTGLEEGLKENITGEYTTNWRLAAPSIGFIKADPELRRRCFPRLEDA